MNARAVAVHRSRRFTLYCDCFCFSGQLSSMPATFPIYQDLLYEDKSYSEAAAQADCTQSHLRNSNKDVEWHTFMLGEQCL